MDNQHPTEGKSLAEIISIRKEKLSKIRELGYEPYAYEFAKSHSCEKVLGDFESLKEEVTVQLAGRIMAIRKMGRASFCHIQDETGRLQVYLRENQIGEKPYELFKLLDIGDILGAMGKVFKTRTGEITLFADEIHLLGGAEVAVDGLGDFVAFVGFFADVEEPHPRSFHVVHQFGVYDAHFRELAQVAGGAVHTRADVQ